MQLDQEQLLPIQPDARLPVEVVSRREALVYYDAAGKRHRHALGTDDLRQAERVTAALFAELTRPKGAPIELLWQSYMRDMRDRAVVGTMTHTWKALRDRFGSLAADENTFFHCRAHVEARRAAGIADGTIHTELGHLRMVLKWAEKRRLIEWAPHIDRPSKPKPQERHLTRTEARKLIDAAATPHVRLFVILALATGARSAALLELTWDRCDFERERIDLRNPALATPHKGRAIVPMNRTLKAALLEAREGALTDYVIEWGGKPVRSVKRGVAFAARTAGLQKVSPHLLRHSHMAEAGVAMEEIAQYLGHSDVGVTRRIYARFSPDHLRRAAAVLEYDDPGSLNQREVRKSPLCT